MQKIGKKRKVPQGLLILALLTSLASCGGGYYDDGYNDAIYDDYQSYTEPDYYEYEPDYQEYDPDYYDYEPDYYEYEPDYYEPDYGY